jgi:hypothetical protein
MGFVFQLVLFVASTAYQMIKQKKLKEKMEREADKRKGSIFTVKNEATVLPVVYGRQLLGGVQYDHRISRDFYYEKPINNSLIFDSTSENPAIFNNEMYYTTSGVSTQISNFEDLFFFCQSDPDLNTFSVGDLITITDVKQLDYNDNQNSVLAKLYDPNAPKRVEGYVIEADSTINPGFSRAVSTGEYTGFDTSSYQVDDILYIMTDGSIQNVEAGDENILQIFGIVKTIDAVNGKVFVNIDSSQARNPEVSSVPLSSDPNSDQEYVVSMTLASNFASSGSSLTEGVVSSKNEIMMAKHAICHAGINSVKHVLVDNKPWYHRDFKKGVLLNVCLDGGVNPILVANGFPDSDKFTNVCYAATVFRLDRDEQNFSGAPDVQYLVEGMKVRTIDYDELTETYSINEERVFSNNPAYVLLDYLTNDIFGRGLSDDEIDLETFYHAAQICATIVKENAEISGNIFGSKPVSSYPTYSDFPDPNAWGFEDIFLKDDAENQYYIWKKTGGSNDDPLGVFEKIDGLPTRNIPLYEANITLDPEESVRDNIEAIMNTMAYSELVWGSNGKYKLLLEHPTTEEETEALVQVSFNEDNILRDSFSINFPSAEDRYNFVTVNFLNEHKNFKTDTVSWPEKGSSVHTTYYEEDNYQPFETSVKAEGVSDPYHALALAEHTVRSSRSLFTVNFKANKDALVLEPGDFIDVTLEAAGFDTAVIMRVQEVKISESFTVEITAYFYDPAVLAWNVDDDIAYPEGQNYVTVVDAITDPVITDPTDSNPTICAILSWQHPDEDYEDIYNYEVYYKRSIDDTYKYFTSTRFNSVNIPLLEGAPAHTVFDFKIRTVSPFGNKSIFIYLLNQELNFKPDSVNALSATEELYLTNNASGVKSRVNFSWDVSNLDVLPYYYKLEKKLSTESSYSTLGTYNTTSVQIPDLEIGAYSFRLTPYSIFDVAGNPTSITKQIVGFSAIPSDPTGLTGNVNEGQINLSWNLSSDLDVLYGGSIQIRHHIAEDATASWDSASILVNSLPGNTDNKTVPLMKGTFFIKFRDSSGNFSDNSSLFINTFEDLTFNQVEVMNESDSNFGGVKTNCSVVNSQLVLNNNELSMSYLFNDVIDLGEVVSVRITPSIIGNVIDVTDTVDGYSNVALIPNFAGTVKNASLNIYVSTTQDDPSGSPTWTSYDLLTISSFKCRALRFKFEGEVDNENTQILLDELSIKVDKKDIIKYGASTSSTSSDTFITFSTPFYGGPGGTNNPTIGIQVINGSQGDEIVISSRDKTGFNYSIYNTGSRVQRDIDWQAIGQ